MHILLLSAKEGIPVGLESMPTDDCVSTLMALHKLAIRALLDRCPWRELTLSARATHILERHRINTFDELIQYTPSRLQGLQGCGRRSCEEIQAAIATIGLCLRSEPQEEKG